MPKFICISAANIERARNRSASTRTCELIAGLLHDELGDQAEVEIVRLIDYELNPCRMCGECFNKLHCDRDPAFNQIFEKLLEADAVFIVSPHYAPIPSKLVMLFEKLEEMVFLQITDDPNYRFPLYRKPVGIVAHGGQTESAVSYYKSALLDPIATALSSVQMRIVGATDEWPYGVAFGIEDIKKSEDSIFVEISHNWEKIRERITPLVRNVAALTV